MRRGGRGLSDLLLASSAPHNVHPSFTEGLLLIIVAMYFRQAMLFQRAEPHPVFHQSDKSLDTLWTFTI